MKSFNSTHSKNIYLILYNRKKILLEFDIQNMFKMKKKFTLVYYEF